MRSFFKKIVFLFIVVSNLLQAADVVIVMGPSCSGKSTLAKALAGKMGKLWQMVDLDDVIEDVRMHSIDVRESINSDLDYLSIAVNKILDTGKSVVIDTNTYQEGFEKKLHATNVKKVLVYCSLPELIKRDLKRTENLKRDERKAKIAKEFVLSSFDDFFSFEQKIGKPTSDMIPRFSCDICVDSSVNAGAYLVDEIIMTCML